MRESRHGEQSSVDETAVASVIKIHQRGAHVNVSLLAGMYSSPASIFTVNAVPPGPDLFITAFRDELMDAGPIQTSTICLACRQGENGGNRQVPNSQVILNITLVNNLEFVSIFCSSDAMRCICSHRHNPDTPRHTRRHPNIDTEPKTGCG